MLDYINEVGDEKLKNKINEFSLKYFLNDIDCPVDYEPSGTCSSSLTSYLDQKLEQ